MTQRKTEPNVPSFAAMKIAELMARSPGMNKNQLAKLAGVPYPLLYRFLKGDTASLRLDYLSRVAKALGVTVDDLTVDDPVPEPTDAAPSSDAMPPGLAKAISVLEAVGDVLGDDDKEEVTKTALSMPRFFNAPPEWWARLIRMILDLPKK